MAQGFVWQLMALNIANTLNEFSDTSLIKIVCYAMHCDIYQLLFRVSSTAVT